MEHSTSLPTEEEEKKAFKRFAAKRMAVAIASIVAVLWILGFLLSTCSKPKGTPAERAPHSEGAASREKALPFPHEPGAPASAFSERPGPSDRQPGLSPEIAQPAPQPGQTPGFLHATPAQKRVDSTPKAVPAQPEHDLSGDHEVKPHTQVRFPVRGMAFVNALVKPLGYELEERFWGWRSNDLIEFTDNVNAFQLGVLEVTRRSAVILAERISRTGSTEAFDRNLENAMNWFMIKSDKYWFPSSESKYGDGLEELKIYFKKLEKKQATFYTRTDNLIPLLMVYEDLLGSCDENLVKQREKDGTRVSFFRADNYFYYAKGVASAMLTLMEAVSVDFDATVESRRGSEVLHHAIESLQMATKIDPWIVFNSGLSGFFANHRANLAAPISHARFYLGVLIKTLST